MIVDNMTSPNGNKVANQFIIDDGHRTVFQSYESTIAVINRDNMTIEIHPSWDYSRTTGKYKNIFFDECNLHELASKAGLVKAMKEGRAYGFKVVAV